MTWHDPNMQTSSAPTLGPTQCHASSGHSRPDDNNRVCSTWQKHANRVCYKRSAALPLESSGACRGSTCQSSLWMPMVSTTRCDCFLLGYGYSSTSGMNRVHVHAHEPPTYQHLGTVSNAMQSLERGTIVRENKACHHGNIHRVQAWTGNHMRPPVRFCSTRPA